MARYSEAHNRATQKYQKKVYETKVIRFRDNFLSKVLEPALDGTGKSVSAFILEAINEKLERDGLLPAREDDPEEIPPAL